MDLLTDLGYTFHWLYLQFLIGKEVFSFTDSLVVFTNF